MNKVFLIGNLTRDPEIRTTTTGIQVCNFSIAVNRRRRAEGTQETDFFNIVAWRQLADLCSKYLSKGRKVAVTGSVSVSTYTGNDGTTRASLEVTADDVEFLSPRGEGGEAPVAPRPQAAPAAPQSNGFVQVDDDELPF